MNIQTLKKDLESQGFSGNLEKSEDTEYLVFGISLKDGKIPVQMFAKVSAGLILISTVDLIEDANLNDLPYLMTLNDLMATGKLFLSSDIDDLEKIGDKDELTVDYGFEILEQHYSNEVLADYIQRMFENLENLLFSE